MSSKTKKCTKCDKNNDRNNRFCIYCGTKFIKEAVGINPSLYRDIRNSYDGLFISLLVKVAKVDGKITQVEAKILESVFDRLSSFRQDTSNIRDIYKQILAQEKENFDNVAEICNNLLALGITEYDKLDFIDSLLALTYSDGTFNHHNENLIIKIVCFLHIDFSLYQKIKSKFEPQKQEQTHGDQTFTGGHLSLEKCYQVLEITANDSNQTIKQNYRKMVRNYHTDILSSKDLPKDMIAFAEEKLKKINRAYETLKHYKGIK